RRRSSRWKTTGTCWPRWRTSSAASRYSLSGANARVPASAPHADRFPSARRSTEPAMKIHEYQAKAILAEFGVPVPQGRVAGSPDEARQIAQELGGKVVVKAQIHAGGRGKGGGVKLANSADEARQAASQIIGMQLVTHQTGPQGQKVK